jgi:prepilin-type N-terminal cleavage/methylation domain-containing protein
VDVIQTTAGSNKEGFTLIEVMIAMLISVIGLLALANVAVMAIDTNMGNLLRDEAVRVADLRINGQLQLTNNTGAAMGAPWQGLKNLTNAQLTALVAANATCPAGVVLGESKGVQRTYTVCWRITQPSANSNAFLAEVWVGWNYKGGTAGGLVPTGQTFQHGISTMITKLPTDR